MENHQEFTVEITAVSRVGVVVRVGEVDGFIDQTKHPSWRLDVEPPKVGDRLLAVVVDAARTPPRLSALEKDIEIARRLRSAP